MLQHVTCYDIKHQKDCVSKPGKWTFYSIIRKLQKQNPQTNFHPIYLCISISDYLISVFKQIFSSIVILILIFSAAGEDNEGWVQVSRSQRIMRAQDLLAVACFIQNGEFYRHTTHLHPPDISDLTDQHLTLSGLKGRVSLGPVVAPLVSTRTDWAGCHPGNRTNDPPWPSSCLPHNIFPVYQNTNFTVWIIGNVRVWHNITHNWGRKNISNSN